MVRTCVGGAVACWSGRGKAKRRSTVCSCGGLFGRYGMDGRFSVCFGAVETAVSLSGKGKTVCLSVCLSVVRTVVVGSIGCGEREGGDTMVISSGGNPCGHSAAMRLVRRLLFHGRAGTGAFRRFVQARYEKRGRGVYRPCVAEKSDCGRGRATVRFRRIRCLADSRSMFSCRRSGEPRSVFRFVFSIRAGHRTLCGFRACGCRGIGGPGNLWERLWTVRPWACSAFRGSYFLRVGAVVAAFCGRFGAGRSFGAGRDRAAPKSLPFFGISSLVAVSSGGRSEVRRKKYVDFFAKDWLKWKKCLPLFL